ncbi:unnamed protein product [Echinostoma caproni]|uniref:Uncharacterized protein n=1 Tax=Echinostoma caproni TaxID=27848 RepID=A0A183B5U8_9TREM|nr:unnamed protein product [Echinostoma caproni]
MKVIILLIALHLVLTKAQIPESMCLAQAMTQCDCENLQQAHVDDLEVKCNQCDGCPAFVEKCKAADLTNFLTLSCDEEEDEDE